MSAAAGNQHGEAQCRPCAEQSAACCNRRVGGMHFDLLDEGQGHQIRDAIWPQCRDNVASR